MKLSAPTPEHRRWQVKILTATWLAYAGYYFCRMNFYVVKKALGDSLGFDACTFSPVPGYGNGTDAVYRWAEEKDKGIFALCRMSNPGTHDYQSREMEGEVFYKRLAREATEKGSNGFVVGCTATEELGEIRGIIGPERLILAPGLGAQGGDPETALRLGANSDGEGILVSSSRSINFAYESLGWCWERYAEAAGVLAERKRDELNTIRDRIYS